MIAGRGEILNLMWRDIDFSRNLNYGSEVEKRREEVLANVRAPEGGPQGREDQGRLGGTSTRRKSQGYLGGSLPHIREEPQRGFLKGSLKG